MGEEKVLELKPLKKKSLNLFLIESEFPIDWFFEKPKSKNGNLVWDLNLVSKQYVDLMEKYIDKYAPNFAVEEKGMRSDEVMESDPLAKLFKRKGIVYRLVDISENAEDYLRASLDEHKFLIDQITGKIDRMMKENGKPPLGDELFEQLVLWREYLQREYDEKENEVRYDVREAWMMMKIVNLAKELKENKLKGLFICDQSHFEGITKLAEQLNVKATEIKLQKTVQVENAPIMLNTDGSVSNPHTPEKKSMFELSGLKIKKKDNSDKICYFFDTDENASPFDINMAYDAGFDVVVPVSHMTSEKVPKLVQDAIFSRKPKAPTTFFIGGANVNEGEQIAKKVLKSLVPPFECPVIIDPRGSHTTASAVVAKTLYDAEKVHKMDNLEGKKVVIMGAGPVARIAAILGAKLHMDTYIVETWDKSSKEATESLAKELNDAAGDEASEIKGLFAPTEKERVKIAKDAEIIWSLAAAGVEVLSSNAMEKLEGKKIVVDINLVPPYGIEGIKPKHDNEEIYPEIFGIGALALGRLKSNSEAQILKEAANTKGKKIYDYNYAFEVAKDLLYH